MNLLIFTQVVDKNHGELSFFLTWIKEFAKIYKKVIVICLYKGEFDLPGNVKVLSLGKEDGVSRIKYLFRFYKYIFSLRKSYDHVFVHMNPIYVVLGGLFWSSMGKKIGLWFAHGSTSRQLRLAEKFVDNIFTSTKEGCRIKSDKIRIVGQGIDLEKFHVPDFKANNSHEKLYILTVGRISPAKDLETLIKAAEILVSEGVNIKVNIVGGVPFEEHKDYFNSLKKMVVEKGLNKAVSFIGKVPFEKVNEYFSQADLFINTSHTGSLDKVILEAICSGALPLTCNEAAFEVLGEYINDLSFKKKDYQELALKIKQLINMEFDKKNKIIIELNRKVKEEHGLKNLIEKIVNKYK